MSTIVIKHFILDVCRNPGFTSVFAGIQTGCKYLQAFTHKSSRTVLIRDNGGVLKILCVMKPFLQKQFSQKKLSQMQIFERVVNIPMGQYGTKTPTLLKGCKFPLRISFGFPRNQSTLHIYTVWKVELYQRSMSSGKRSSFMRPVCFHRHHELEG